MISSSHDIIQYKSFPALGELAGTRTQMTQKSVAAVSLGAAPQAFLYTSLILFLHLVNWFYCHVSECFCLTASFGFILKLIKVQFQYLAFWQSGTFSVPVNPSMAVIKITMSRVNSLKHLLQCEKASSFTIVKMCIFGDKNKSVCVCACVCTSFCL